MSKTIYKREAIDYIIDRCGKFTKYCNETEKITPEKLSIKWNKCFIDICQYMGINNLSAAVLFEDMCMGNWEHLHKTDEENKMSQKEWLNKLADDVWYCSDRWSIDRLMRCHWYYRQVMKKFKK